MIFVFILLLFLFSGEVSAEECDSSFIALPEIFHEEGSERKCRFNPLLHINTDDRAAID